MVGANFFYTEWFAPPNKSGWLRDWYVQYSLCPHNHCLHCVELCTDLGGLMLVFMQRPGWPGASVHLVPWIYLYVF